MVEYQTENLKLANSLLLGKKIKLVRYASEKELKTMMWDGEDLIVIVMEDGTLFYPSRDHEGNGPGVLMLQTQSEEFHQF